MLTVFSAASCAPQTDHRRWSLRADGMLIVPLADLRIAAAFRLVQDNRVKSMAWQSAQYAHISLEKDRLLAGKDLELSALRDALKATDDALAATEGERDEWKKDARRKAGNRWWQLPAVGLGCFAVGKMVSR